MSSEFEGLVQILETKGLGREFLEGGKSLEDLGVSAESASDFLKIVHLLERGRSMDDFERQSYENQYSSNNELWNNVRRSLTATLTQIEKGFEHTALMYNVTFYAGIALVASAVVFALLGRGSLLPIAMGGLGTLDIVAFFVVGPAERLERSRTGLAQLNAAVYTWIVDNYYWGAFLSARGPKCTLEQTQEVSAMMFANMERVVKTMNDYCRQTPQGAAKRAANSGSKRTAVPKSAEA